jgi:anaerobic ribonucleoside-triphosphate reductase activating protein
MKYGRIFELDGANGIGCRTSLFVSGCTHHCEGCFNQETWDFDYGSEFTLNTVNYILSTLSNEFTDGISILGGEPMETPNQRALLPLICSVRAMGKSVWVYSGYTWEELTDLRNRRCRGPYTDLILSQIDVLVDGEFVQAQKDLRLKFRGSSNQRIIDVPRSLSEGRPVILDI